jgi:Uma2 family endonuclease
MVLAPLRSHALEEFEQLPNIEESPAWELLNGHVLQKPMPTFHQCRLQKRLVNAIDDTRSSYEAFPELRCILSQNSVVPDIAIIDRQRIPTSNEPIQGAPDWLIEILSPDQSTTKLIAKIQTCLDEGTQLGWLIDSTEEVVMIFLPDLPLRLIQSDTLLPTLHGISLELTPSQIFAWLN